MTLEAAAAFAELAHPAVAAAPWLDLADSLAREPVLAANKDMGNPTHKDRDTPMDSSRRDNNSIRTASRRSLARRSQSTA